MSALAEIDGVAIDYVARFNQAPVNMVLDVGTYLAVMEETRVAGMAEMRTRLSLSVGFVALTVVGVEVRTIIACGSPRDECLRHGRRKVKG